MADTTYSVTSGFYDAVENDRLYTADQMNMPYKRLVSNGVFASPDGSGSTDFQVTAGSGMSVNVLAGNAIVGDKWVESGATVPVEVPGNSALNSRSDSVILRVDKTNSVRAASIILRTGTAATSPTPPDLVTTAGIYEYRLANITVAPNASSISQAAITDCRGTTECPWITSLIYQVDTSTLMLQFEAAYAAKMAGFTDQWDQFFAQLTSDLSLATNILTYRNEYTAAGAVTEIPIGIEQYDKSTDLLQVYINGLMAQEGVFYTVDADSEGITLTNAIGAGDKVYFVVMKSIITGNAQTMQNEIESLKAAVGSPLVANTAADMTDEDKIYVYTGSETGYTAGDWYYYNGSAWTSGGTYNSTAVQTDPGLTISGMAADAKATGDAIAAKVSASVTGTKLNLTFTTT